jgi:acyl-coenzyme A synthetase/AMP-(fatty) acid ligase
MEKILSDESGLRHYPYTKSYVDAEDDTTCIIHSSGTTGKVHERGIVNPR